MSSSESGTSAVVHSEPWSDRILQVPAVTEGNVRTNFPGVAAAIVSQYFLAKLHGVFHFKLALVIDWEPPCSGLN